MNLKKFISGVSAITIAASTFAALAITANAAATTIYSNDFETSSDFTTEVSSGAQVWNPNTSTTKNSNVVGVGSGSGDNGMHSPVFNAIANYDSAQILGVSFDFKMEGCTGGKSSNIALLGSRNPNKWLDSSTQIFTINASANGNNGYWSTITANGTDIRSAVIETGNKDMGIDRDSTGWVSFDAVIDFNSKTVSYTMSKGGAVVVGPATTAFLNDTNTLYELFVAAGKGYGGVLIDNVVVKRLTVPSIGLDKNSVDIGSIGGTATVVPTYPSANGDALSFSYSTAGVATAVLDGNNIVVTGDAEGTTRITVTDTTTEGLVATSYFDVTVGNVSKADVTVNFFKTGTSTSVKEAVTLENRSDGSEITSSDIDITTFENAVGRYTYNPAISTSLPYTVDASGSNVINIYYDEDLAVDHVTLLYKVNGEGNAVATSVKTVSGYVNDTVTIHDNFYVKGSNGVVYSTTGSDPYSTLGTTTIGEGNAVNTTQYNGATRSVTLTSTDTQYTVNVAVAANAIEYIEAGEKIGAAESDGNAYGRLKKSGDAMGRISNNTEIYNVPETAAYQIVMVYGQHQSYTTIIRNSSNVDILTSDSANHNTANGKVTVANAVLTANDTLKIVGTYNNNTTAIDYILIRKLGDYALTYDLDTDVVEYYDSGDTATLAAAEDGYTGWLVGGVYYAAGASYTVNGNVTAIPANGADKGAVTALGTYTTDEGDFAKAFTFTVTPNAETITSVTVTDAADSTKSVTKSGLSLSGSGSITFGILVTASDAANLDKTFNVTLN